MRPRIAVLDYGAGNLTSVRKGLVAAGAEPCMPASPSELTAAAGIVIPGVGHFSATQSLTKEWRETILKVKNDGTIVLGICLGMQWLYEGSDEAPAVAGLGVLAGRCFRIAGEGLKVPHVGWNTLATRQSCLFASVPDGAYAYFTHSYAAPVTTACTAITQHGAAFAAAAENGNVFGVQFHPEKSGPAGLQVLRNFVALARRR
jgi:glutamine amidotransferase